MMPTFSIPCSQCCGGKLPCNLDCGPSCPQISETWDITITGVTNSGCTNCNGLNNSFSLVRTNNLTLCEWKSAAGDLGCGTPNTEISLFHNVSSHAWILTIANIPSALYGIIATGFIDDSNFQCLGPNTFTMTWISSCNGPATLTITPGPSDCALSTGCCVDAIPSTIFATITNIDHCACAEGSFTLYWDSGFQGWISIKAFCPTFGKLKIKCNEATQKWEVSVLNCLSQTDVDEISCDPLEIHFTNISVNAVCCGAAGHVDIVVTS